MRTTTPNWCAVLSGGVNQGKSRDAQCLGTCTPSRSRKLPQQRDSGGEFFCAKRQGGELKVSDLSSFTPRYVGNGQGGNRIPSL